MRLVSAAADGAVAGDVADREEVVLAGLPRVVEVAAHLGALAGRPVARDDLGAGRLRQRARQEALLQGVGDVVLDAVEARVVDREGRAPREVLGDRELLPAEPPAGVGDRERERPEHPAVGCERRDDRGAHAEHARHRHELLVGRLLLGEPTRDVLDQLRMARGERAGDPARGLRPDGPALVHAAGEPRQRRVGVGNADVADLAVVEHVDRAPVGEPRDGELDELA